MNSFKIATAKMSDAVTSVNCGSVIQMLLLNIGQKYFTSDIPALPFKANHLTASTATASIHATLWNSGTYCRRKRNINKTRHLTHSKRGIYLSTIWPCFFTDCIDFDLARTQINLSESRCSAKVSSLSAHVAPMLRQ